MTLRIEDYALIGDTQTAALVGVNGSIDWLCLPRFDSDACLAALLGDLSHGHWRIAPSGGLRSVSRRYRPDTLVLETTFVTDQGTVQVIDFMPRRRTTPRVVRIVEGVSGRVEMRMDLRVRFDYGSVVPWVREEDDGRLSLTAGPDGLSFYSDVPTRGEDKATVADFGIASGERASFVLVCHGSHTSPPRRINPLRAREDCERDWRSWARKCTYKGPWRDEVVRSLMTLKALTYAPSGGIVAAATTSLPEEIGGIRNWDYRYCWLRDATFTVYALISTGYFEEAVAFRDWLFRAVAGDPSQMQIMYGVDGERRLNETELAWLPGYEGSKPVRIGNGAHDQFQLDVYGEILGTAWVARRAGLAAQERTREIGRAILEFLSTAWTEPDEGVWEIRGRRRHFTYSKIMAWQAFNLAIRDVHDDGRWHVPHGVIAGIRDTIHRDILDNGYDADLNAFTQYYGSNALDGSLLGLPLSGLLHRLDPRVIGTVDAIVDRLADGDFVWRYATDAEVAVDGLTGREGSFLALSFLLVDALARTGRIHEARNRFERLVAVANDVGLYAEEYDPVAGRMLGNFPQALTHISLVTAALTLQRYAPPDDNLA